MAWAAGCGEGPVVEEDAAGEDAGASREEDARASRDDASLDATVAHDGAVLRDAARPDGAVLLDASASSDASSDVALAVDATVLDAWDGPDTAPEEMDAATSVDDASRPDAAVTVDAATVSIDACVPRCTGRECGPDGCGGTCAPGCSGGALCAGDGTCGPAPPPVRDLALGDQHACAVRADRTVVCWGRNTFANLGDRTTTDRAAPVSVIGPFDVILGDATEVAAGNGFSCARQSSGDVRCWGANDAGQLGDGSGVAMGTIPTRVLGLPSPSLELVLGDAFGCARVAGAVYCWGSNTDGQLGDGSTTDRARPVAVRLLDDATSLAAGAGHACAIRATGTVACWGDNASGALGDGTTIDRHTPTPVPGITDAIELAAGRTHTCARHRDGHLSCWGSSLHGQLGDGTTTSRLAPTRVTGITDAITLGLGRDHSCAITRTGAVWCWGWGDALQLGDGTRTTRLVATPTRITSGAISVRGGRDATCVRTTSGGVQCWGDAVHGQRGDGTTSTHATAVSAVLVDRDVVAVATGHDHSCGLRASGAIECWGDNAFAQLGDGTQETPIGVVDVLGIVDAVEIGAGYRHTCARRTGGTVRCWGSGLHGQLGTGDLANRATPDTDVVGLTDATQIAIGWSVGCALRASGAVVCWGRGSDGGLGNGVTSDAMAPVPVTGVADATQIAVGGDPSHDHACARRATGAIVCWGTAIGGLGDGATSSRATPVTVSGLADALEVSAGGSHSCARRPTGAVLCWGLGIGGQIGDGSWMTRPTPVSVSGVADAASLALGGDRSCARRRDGSVACWGDASPFGTLGHGALTDSNLPVAALGVSATTQLAVSPITTLTGHACAARLDAPPLCWGDDQRGQLGIEEPPVSNVLGLP
ncbi:MAG: hypothetical protein U0353_33350 [Sandaracinus sp.]